LSIARGQGVLIDGRTIILIDLGTGGTVRTFDLEESNIMEGQALIVDGKIIVTTSGGLHCIDAKKAGLSGWSHCAGTSLRNGADRT
jgi:outer membrane protein assembly factor BamB